MATLPTPVITLANQGRVTRDVQFGTNPPTTSITTSQSVDASTQTDPAPGGAPGGGAERDDAVKTTGNKSQQIVNAAFSGPEGKIVPRDNALDDYASYTYAISWYLTTPSLYNEMVNTQSKSVTGFKLLMQSGGAPEKGSAGELASRANYFDLDYYLDDLEIETLTPGRGTRAAHTATKIKFKVTEPNGVTLIENLAKTVQELYKNEAPTINYPMAQYCLVIRFYGYDDNGNLVKAKGTNLTDPKAVIEKFYPFVISNITFRVVSRQIEYTITGVPIGHFANLSRDRGTIPFSFGLSGTTVQEVLNGQGNSASVNPSPDDGRQTNSVPYGYNDAENQEGGFYGDTLPDLVEL